MWARGIVSTVCSDRCASVFCVPYVWSICAQRWAEEKYIRVCYHKKRPTPREAHLEVRLLDVHVHLVNLWKHSHCDSGGVESAPTLRQRNTLHLRPHWKSQGDPNHLSTTTPGTTAPGQPTITTTFKHDKTQRVHQPDARHSRASTVLHKGRTNMGTAGESREPTPHA